MAIAKTPQPCPSLMRLSDSERQEVERYLAKDRARQANPKNSRASPRFRYLPSDPIGLNIVTDGKPQPYSVIGKDLSATGCGLLHGAFVYPGTRCETTLATRAGERFEIEGTVVRCGHIVGRVHELGIRFDQAILLEQFVDAAPEATLGASAAAMSRPEKMLDTPGLQRLIAEIAALAGNKDCPAVLRKKIQDLARLSDFVAVQTGGAARAAKSAASAEQHKQAA